MKNQTIGVEIEMTGITRFTAANIVASCLNGIVSYSNDCYDTYKVTAPDGRIWKVMSDASIVCKRKSGDLLINADSTYSVEFVTPILKYDADIDILQEIVRQLRHIGAISDSAYKCGIHIHIGAQNHTPNTLKNLVNLMAVKEDLIYKSLQIDPARVHYCQKVNEKLLETINRRKPKTITELADIWYVDSHESRNMHYNSTRYHGLNLHSVFTNGTIEFKLFNGTLHAGKIRSYIVFCLAVSHQALTQKTVSCHRSVTDNEKYTFRYAQLRKMLS